MKANTQALDEVPDPRWTLMEWLQAIKAKRAEYQEAEGQRQRLRGLIEAEAVAQAKVDALKQRDVQDLAEQLVNPTGLHITVDHGAQGEAEWDLMRARREADVARACEPAVIERMAASSREIAAIEERTLPMAVEIMLDDARALAAEIDADARRLRGKYARLWGLRRYLGDTPAVLKRLEDMPAPTHPDHVDPDVGELVIAAEAWRRYATRLVADPDAEFEG
jgi:hypothetical protein